MATCKDCKKYPGDCGNHGTDCYGHIDYNTAGKNHYLSTLDDPDCFEPTPAYNLVKRKMAVARLIRNFEPEIIKAAYEEIMGETNNDDCK